MVEWVALYAPAPPNYGGTCPQPLPESGVGGPRAVNGDFDWLALHLRHLYAFNNISLDKEKDKDDRGMPTPMPGMGTTIKAITDAGLRDKVKIIIGGAPVTQAYADQIGADGFAKDASQAASLAKSFLV